MRTHWEVTFTTLRRTYVEVIAFAASNHDRDYYSESAGRLNFHVSLAESSKWWAGRHFELEIPYVTPTSTPRVVAADEELDESLTADVYEERGNTPVRGLFGRRHAN